MAREVCGDLFDILTPGVLHVSSHAIAGAVLGPAVLQGEAGHDPNEAYVAKYTATKVRGRLARGASEFAVSACSGTHTARAPLSSLNSEGCTPCCCWCAVGATRTDPDVQDELSVDLWAEAVVLRDDRPVLV